MTASCCKSGLRWLVQLQVSGPKEQRTQSQGSGDEPLVAAKQCGSAVHIAVRARNGGAPLLLHRPNYQVHFSSAKPSFHATCFAIIIILERKTNSASFRPLFLRVILVPGSYQNARTLQMGTHLPPPCLTSIREILWDEVRLERFHILRHRVTRPNTLTL